MKKKLIPALLGLVMAGIAGGAMAANPVLLSSTGGKYCYDFGGYIPSIDSPVVGGLYRAAKEASFYGDERSYVASGFGRACLTAPIAALLPHTGAGGVYAPWFDYTERVSSYQWVSGGDNPSFRVESYHNKEAPILCPDNHAPIRVHSYRRSDGVSANPVHHGDISPWGVHPSYPAYFISRGDFVASLVGSYWLEPSKKWPVDVCVKTDTTM